MSAAAAIHNLFASACSTTTEPCHQTNSNTTLPTSEYRCKYYVYQRSRCGSSPASSSPSTERLSPRKNEYSSISSRSCSCWLTSQAAGGRMHTSHIVSRSSTAFAVETRCLPRTDKRAKPSPLCQRPIVVCLSTLVLDGPHCGSDRLFASRATE